MTDPMSEERLAEIEFSRFDVRVLGDATYEMDRWAHIGGWMKAEHGAELIAEVRRLQAHLRMRTDEWKTALGERDDNRKRAKKAEARVAGLEGEVERLRQGLISVEWGEVELGDEGRCPCCGNTRDVGHTVGCCVGEAIREQVRADD